MARRATLLAIFFVLLVGETIFFVQQSVADFARLAGERALFKNDHRRAWRGYQRAIAWGARRERVETDLVELLLFGLDQTSARMKIDVPLPEGSAILASLDLLSRRILEAPHRAAYWSLASDVYLHAGRLRRKETSIDLSALSEDPIANLLPEERLSVVALEVAARLEPNSFLYHGLLTETFLEIGSPARAAEHCRRAVAAYPALDAHLFLLRPDLPAELIEAAIQGFDEGREVESMIPKAQIECDAGRFLAANGRDRRALEYLERAAAIAPRFYDARVHLGFVSYRVGDYESAVVHLKEATSIRPEHPWPYYYLGLSHLELGQREAAIAAFRVARERDPRNIRFFHRLGESLEAAGQIKEAERQFLAAANLNPKEARAWSSLRDFYVRQKDFVAASKACSRLVGMQPDVYGEECASVERGVR